MHSDGKTQGIVPKIDKKPRNTEAVISKFGVDFLPTAFWIKPIMNAAFYPEEITNNVICYLGRISKKF